MTEQPFTYVPLDVRCPVADCYAPPGKRCVWRRLNGKPTFRQPHAERVTLARDASARSRERAARRGWQPPPPWQPPT